MLTVHKLPYDSHVIELSDILQVYTGEGDDDDEAEFRELRVSHF